MLVIILDIEEIVVIASYIAQTAKVIHRWDLGFKSHPKEWRRPGWNQRPLVYKASNLTTAQKKLLLQKWNQGITSIQTATESIAWNNSYTSVVTGQLRYVKLAYLENTTCVEVIVHPELFPYILLYFDLVCVELAYDENLAVSK